jgi:hypothetical protein
MKKKVFCIVIVLLFFTTFSAAVETNANTVFRTSPAPHGSGVWLHQSTTAPSSTDNYLHYDDGSCEDAVGWAKGDKYPPLYEVIKFTPTELGDLHGAFDKIKIMHGCRTQPDEFCDKENYTAWMYTGVNPPPSPTENTTMVASGFCEVINDFFYFNLTNPYPFTENDTVWIGVGWDARVGTYPGGFDTDTCTPAKGGICWFGYWTELYLNGFSGNWNLQVHVTGNDTGPPVTTCTLFGINTIWIFLEACDIFSGVAYTVYSLDGGPITNYTHSFLVSEPGIHHLMFYSVDNAGNREMPKYQSFTIPYNISISIKGGRGITATIHNNGETAITINGTIAVTGFVFPKEKPFFETIPARGDIQVYDKVIGFGVSRITVTAVNETMMEKVCVILFFVIPLSINS